MGVSAHSRNAEVQTVPRLWGRRSHHIALYICSLGECGPHPVLCWLPKLSTVCGRAMGDAIWGER